MYKNTSYASTKVNQPCHGNGWTQESMSLFYGLFRTTPTLEAYWSSTVACLVLEISLPADLQRRSSPTISVQCRTSGDQANGALCRRKTSFLTMSIKFTISQTRTKALANSIERQSCASDRGAKNCLPSIVLGGGECFFFCGDPTSTEVA